MEQSMKFLSDSSFHPELHGEPPAFSPVGSCYFISGPGREVEAGRRSWCYSSTPSADESTLLSRLPGLQLSWSVSLPSSLKLCQSSVAIQYVHSTMSAHYLLQKLWSCILIETAKNRAASIISSPWNSFVFTHLSPKVWCFCWITEFMIHILKFQSIFCHYFVHFPYMTI